MTIVDWLLDSDPSIRWQVLRDLTDAPAEDVAAERARVATEGAAASFMLDDRGERMVDGAFEEAKSALDIFVKDMGLVTDAARASSYPAPLASAAEQLYLAGRRAGLGRLDDSSLIRVMRGE